MSGCNSIDDEGNMARCELFDVTEDKLQLPYEEKLAMFERDAETLYEFALTKGLSTSQIRTCLSPILGSKMSFGKRLATDSSRTIIILSVVIALCSILWAAPTSKNLIIVHAKLLSMKTIPLWDWTTLYYEECLINNPFLPVEKNFTADECDGCIDFGQIESLNETDMELVTDNLQSDVPFLVTDAMKGWPKDTNGDMMFSLDKLNAMFEQHKVLTDATTECEFVSTMDDKSNIAEFVKALQVEDFPEKFHVSWENCDANAAKVFRMLGSRPYFFPPFAEASPYNQVIVAKGNFDDDEFTLPQQIDSASWLIVVDGEMQITLTPHKSCLNFKCMESTFSIGPGEAVVVPSRIWNMTYTPISDWYTLGYASTLLWDDAF